MTSSSIAYARASPPLSSTAVTAIAVGTCRRTMRNTASAASTGSGASGWMYSSRGSTACSPQSLRDRRRLQDVEVVGDVAGVLRRVLLADPDRGLAHRARVI